MDEGGHSNKMPDGIGLKIVTDRGSEKAPGIASKMCDEKCREIFGRAAILIDKDPLGTPTGGAANGPRKGTRKGTLFTRPN